MSLYLCIFEEEREVDGVEIGAYADFNALRQAVIREAGPAEAAALFPTLLGHSDCDGAWSPENCASLLRELAAIAAALRQRPPVAFPSPWQEEAARAAGLRPRDASECFVDVDGVCLLERLQRLAETAVRLRQPILFQ